jgi:hypothetical protein
MRETWVEIEDILRQVMAIEKVPVDEFRFIRFRRRMRRRGFGNEVQCNVYPLQTGTMSVSRW